MNRQARVIPVLDLMGGVVVRGIAGKRNEYRPIQSTICDSADPVEVARAIVVRTGIRDFYVADLDSIMYGNLQGVVVGRLLSELGIGTYLDAGIVEPRRVAELLERRVNVVLGLESLASPESLFRLAEACDISRLTFSLDLKNGRPMCSGSGWASLSPTEIVDLAVGIGLNSVIVLDLAAVGTAEGPKVLELCRTVRERNPAIEMISGGGVASVDDIDAFRDAGVDRVLVSTAFHNGSLESLYLPCWDGIPPDSDFEPEHS